jgi:hypothetical protein
MAKKSLNFTRDDVEGKIEFDCGGTHYIESMANLKLEAMTPVEIRTALDRCVPKYAYWSNILADVAKTIRETETSYELWFAEKYSDISGKWTETKGRYVAEGTKKNEVILMNIKEYKKWQRDLNDLYFVRDKLMLLVRSYEMQSRLLQTIASLLKTELGMLGKEE